MLEQKLDSSRKDLLDLSARNRLINTRRTATRSSRLDVVDELADEVFRILVTEKRKMSFLPKPESGDDDSPDDNNDVVELEAEDNHDSWGLAQPNDGEETEGLAARHSDDKLQTKLVGEKLQKKLLKLSYEARTSEEEQGVNTLYLAIGFLKWFESNRSDADRQAPLILIPVTLERSSANAKFRLSWDENEISTNLSLQEKLKAEFGIELPEIGDIEDFVPSEYFEQVQKAVSTKKDWELIPNAMVLWFFSFAKFLMYKDLDASQWPPERSLAENSLIGGLLGDGFHSDPPICSEEKNIDEFLKPIDLIHVVDADSSQTLAIEESKTGRNLVIQGPPGTGKSQTITNIIAAAVNDGKKVLFVAEKMAALQVVHRRLETIGLGPLCIELHSHKANKKAVLQELEATLELGKPKEGNNKLHADELTACRDRLNQHSDEMHTQLMPSRRTPFQIVGQLVRLQTEGAVAPDFEFPEAASWSPEVYRQNLGLIKDLALHLEGIGNPTKHIWRGARVEALLPADHARIQKHIAEIRERLAKIEAANSELSQVFGLPSPVTLVNSVSRANLARLAVKAPEGLDSACITSPVWQSRLDDIRELITVSQDCQQKTNELESSVADVAWDTDLTDTRRHLRAYGRSWFRFFNAKYRSAKADLIGILDCDLPRDLDQQLKIVDGVIAVQKARQKIEASKDLGKEAFGADWNPEDLDCENLSAVAAWHQDCKQQDLPTSFYKVAADQQLKAQLKQATAVVRKNINELVSDVKDLFSKLKLKTSQAFSVEDLKSLPLSELDAKFEVWTDADRGVVEVDRLRCSSEKATAGWDGTVGKSSRSRQRFSRCARTPVSSLLF